MSEGIGEIGQRVGEKLPGARPDGIFYPCEVECSKIAFRYL